MTATTDRPPLTDRQRAVLRFVVQFWGEKGCAPALREIMAAFGWASPNAAVAHLEALAAKGWLQWDRGPGGSGTKARGVVVPELLAAAKAAAGAYLETF